MNVTKHKWCPFCDIYSYHCHTRNKIYSTKVSYDFFFFLFRCSFCVDSQYQFWVFCCILKSEFSFQWKKKITQISTASSLFLVPLEFNHIGITQLAIGNKSRKRKNIQNRLLYKISFIDYECYIHRIRLLQSHIYRLTHSVKYIAYMPHMLLRI